MKQSPTHILFEKHLKELELDFTREYQFYPLRKWRLDYLIGDMKAQIAVEIEGGIHIAGRHTRGKGYQADLDKYNHATAFGYKVLRFSSEDVLRGRAKAFLAEHFEGMEDPQ